MKRGWFARITTSATALLILAAVTMLPVGCQGTGGTSPSGKVIAKTGERAAVDAQAQTDVATLVQGNTELALEVFRSARSAQESVGRNLVFSPHSLSVCSAMIYAGARGQTEIQMAEALHLGLPQDRLHAAYNALDLQLTASRGIEVTIANSLWPFAFSRDRLIADCMDLITRHYSAEVIVPPEDVEQARQAVNKWVEEATDSRIQEVLPSGWRPSDQLVMFFANAVCFSGLWREPFDGGNTNEQAFNLADGGTVQVQMMSNTLECDYAVDDIWQLVVLDYGFPEDQASGYSMVCLRPKEGSLDAALPSLTAQRLHDLLASTKLTNVWLRMPRFEMRSQLELKQLLRSIGMVDAFDRTTADFSGLFTGGAPSGIWIDDIYQTTIITVAELGTEAASGTIGVMEASITVPMRLDCPFVFLIRHQQTGAILFLGQVMDPTAG